MSAMYTLLFLCLLLFFQNHLSSVPLVLIEVYHHVYDGVIGDAGCVVPWHVFFLCIDHLHFRRLQNWGMTSEMNKLKKLQDDDKP